jgi:glucose-6-phosphate dehydrogenase assembly protein OpcA
LADLRLAGAKADKDIVTPIAPVLPVSRAVVRFIEAGNDAVCEHCQLPVKFAARIRGRQVIANVYIDGRWARVEHYHEACYELAGEPCGSPRT